MKDILMKFIKNKPLMVLLVTSIVISILEPRFLTTGNLMTILRQTSINAVIATGMTFVILVGGIDLSVGSVLGFTGAIAATMISGGTNIVVVILTVLILGTFIGFVNGSLITIGRLQPFIATLGTVTLLRGLLLVFSQGRPIGTGNTEGSELFNAIGRGFFGPIPIPVYLMLFIFIIAYYMLNHTRMGRYIYSTGSNEEATMYSGIKTNRVKLFVYAASGMMASIAGVLITARLGSAQPTAGAGYELDAIAAVVLGGTSMAGGIGTITGTAIGALIIGVLNNALNIMQVSSYYQDVAKGIVILVAVLMDRKKKASR
ncbi:ribose ABC transporter permease [Proteiniclasticum ruminis]|uniref:Ribose transport system permease protein n=1 Tax=Proteiniclasticum ruminis TaxID=398199 RepID=A0A1G8JVF3_9CLOT|nr:ribose ABC transporter permease [Proteiniclasticum ruminis]SDI35105.1 ribose transport system permease protein [Proteiniclasticum ruminis]